MNQHPHTQPLGSVILHLRPVPGSWPSTPERRLARLLKYALRTAGYRATRIEPALTKIQHRTTATNDSERVILEYDPAAQRYSIPGYSFSPALANLLADVLTQHLKENAFRNPEPQPEASPSVNV